jgi:hypothetical protein
MRKLTIDRTYTITGLTDLDMWILSKALIIPLHTTGKDIESFASKVNRENKIEESKEVKIHRTSLHNIICSDEENYPIHSDE